jgi:hypothetical protein
MTLGRVDYQTVRGIILVVKHELGETLMLTFILLWQGSSIP